MRDLYKDLPYANHHSHYRNAIKYDVTDPYKQYFSLPVSNVIMISKEGERITFSRTNLTESKYSITNVCPTQNKYYSEYDSGMILKERATGVYKEYTLFSEMGEDIRLDDYTEGSLYIYSRLPKKNIIKYKKYNWSDTIGSSTTFYSDYGFNESMTGYILSLENPNTDIQEIPLEIEESYIERKPLYGYNGDYRIIKDGDRLVIFSDFSNIIPISFNVPNKLLFPTIEYDDSNLIFYITGLVGNTVHTFTVEVDEDFELQDVHRDVLPNTFDAVYDWDEQDEIELYTNSTEPNELYIDKENVIANVFAKEYLDFLSKLHKIEFVGSSKEFGHKNHEEIVDILMEEGKIIEKYSGISDIIAFHAVHNVEKIRDV